MTRDEIKAYIEELPINCEITYIGETEKEDWHCDAWRYKINGVEGNYYTGLAFRRNEKPVAPHLATILCSLFLDAQAVDMNFKEWCHNFGYSQDSIKALSIYMQCIDMGYDLRKMFKPEMYNELKNLLEEC